MSNLLDYRDALLAAGLPVVNVRNVPPLQCDLDPAATQQQLAQAAGITATYQAVKDRKPRPAPDILTDFYALPTGQKNQADKILLDQLRAQILQLFPTLLTAAGINVPGDAPIS